MGRTVRAILIDPFKCTVTVVDHTSGDMRNIYRAISHETAPVTIFDLVYPDDPFRDGDAIFFDREGSMRSITRFFRVVGHGQPIAGKALVLGTSPKGTDDDCATELETVRRVTRFFERTDELGLVGTVKPWAPRHVPA